MSRLFVLALAVGLAHGFSVAPLAARPIARTSIMMADFSVEDAAIICLEEECSVETVDQLIKEMKVEAAANVAGNAAALQRKNVLNNAINKLEALNPEKDASEIEKIVFGASRSFSVVEGFDFPGEPIGYTGKVGTTIIAGKTFDK
jgi:hypothetical protein